MLVPNWEVCSVLIGSEVFVESLGLTFSLLANVHSDELNVGKLTS